MARLKKNDRVRYTPRSKNGPTQAPMLGVITGVSATKGVRFVPDDGWKETERGWTHSVYDLPTFIEGPGRRMEIVSDPLPAHCLLDADDPMVLAGFSAKVTGVCEAEEGHAYNLKVLRHGRDTKIRFNEGGHGGGVGYDTRGADPDTVREFEAACEAWVTHYGVLGPHRGHIEAWSVWQGHMFGLDDYCNKPANFPLRLVAIPEPWEFTFVEAVGRSQYHCEVCGREAEILSGINHHFSEDGETTDHEADADHRCIIEGHPDDAQRALPQYLVTLQVPVKLTGPPPEDPEALRAEIARCLVHIVDVTYNRERQPGIVPWITGFEQTN